MRFEKSNHYLKTDPAVFDAVKSGHKTFELRKDDRGYQVGDVLILQKTKYTGAEMKAGAPLEFTGWDGEKWLPEGLCHLLVTHVLKGPIYGLAEGWVIMSVIQAEVQP